MFKFWSKSGKSESDRNSAVAVAEPMAPVAETLKPTFVGEALEEYLRTANAIGFAPGALLEQRLLNFFAENGIAVYPVNKVMAYLDEKFGKAQGWEKTWCWCPLRKSDNGRLEHGNFKDMNGDIEKRWYHKEVPLPVLLTVQKIGEAFPEVSFYVSDVAMKGDPFLLAWAPGINQLIIERWGEPSFRM